jgi:formiminoglutamase
MGFRIFFEPVDSRLTESLPGQECLGGSLWVNKGDLENWKEADVAIFGINEFRGNGGFNSSNGELHDFRKALYNLAPVNTGMKVYDLGNIKPGQELEDSYQRVSEVVNLLIENNVIPVFVGGSHDLDIGLIGGLANHKKDSRIGIIDKRIDLKPNAGGNLPVDSHLSRIFMDENLMVSGFSVLGYQSYLQDISSVRLMEKLCFEHFRLGSIRDHFEVMEPVIRDLDLLSLDLGAIKMQDFPATVDPVPFGFSGEEFVRLCWYAGNNDFRKGIGFFGYDQRRDVNSQSCNLLAVAIWYFLEGVSSGNPHHHPSTDKDNFNLFTVNLDDKSGEINFFKSKILEKWWVEIPLSAEQKEKYRNGLFISCLYSDYQEALTGELPNRWVQAQTWY